MRLLYFIYRIDWAIHHVIDPHSFRHPYSYKEFWEDDF